MWQGFDGDLRRKFETIRTMAQLTHQTPHREWPLIFVEEHDAMLVVREWPNGEVTAYLTSEVRDGSDTQDGQQ